MNCSALPRADWVLSLEVGEHVPTAFEGMLVRNLHAHNCRGVVLSWAVLNQSGVGHINNHRNEYIVQTFAALGYRYDEARVSAWRANVSGSHRYYRNSLMIFERHQPLACSTSFAG